jgi:hypothetical protein
MSSGASFPLMGRASQTTPTMSRNRIEDIQNKSLAANKCDSTSMLRLMAAPACCSDSPRIAASRVVQRGAVVPQRGRDRGAHRAEHDPHEVRQAGGGRDALGGRPASVISSSAG